MYTKIELSAKRYLLLVIMVAAATPYTNINAATTNDVGSGFVTQEKSHSSAWVTNVGMHPNTFVLIRAIKDSEAHGLNPDSYQLHTIGQDLNSYVTRSEKLGSYLHASNAELRQRLEDNLETAFERFSHDLGAGVLKAQKTQRALFRPAPKVDTQKLLKRLHSGESSIPELLAELTPTAPQYVRLVERMQALLKERDSAVPRTLVRKLKSAKEGAFNPSVIELRTRLKETGDLDSDSQVTTYFGSDVTQALMSVQARHGIKTTGLLDERTVIALNATVDVDIEQIAMNLERWRWMPRELGERHIMVNIPAFNLVMMNGKQRIVDMKVVVGSEENQTPVFSEGAYIIDVAPTWTVPASITNKELIPKELERPGYLESKRMDFLTWKNGKLVEIPPSQITQDDFLTKPFPYTLRQRAGKNNALGKVKILMPNKYAVYMHDTQEKSLFDKTERAYSHGCIRLSDPFRLSSLLMQLDGKTPLETATLLTKKETTRIKLKEKVPTHITYFTAWIDDDGKLHKRRDIYEHNNRLIAGLKQKNTLLSTLKLRSADILAEQMYH